MLSLVVLECLLVKMKIELRSQSWSIQSTMIQLVENISLFSKDLFFYTLSCWNVNQEKGPLLTGIWCLIF